MNESAHELCEIHEGNERHDCKRLSSIQIIRKAEPMHTKQKNKRDFEHN